MDSYVAIRGLYWVTKDKEQPIDDVPPSKLDNLEGAFLMPKYFLQERSIMIRKEEIFK